MIGLLLCLALLEGEGATQVMPPGGTGKAEPLRIKGADLELVESLRAIAGRVEVLRDQSFVRPPLAIRVPDDMRRVASEIRAKNVLSQEQVEARGRAWSDIGLAGPGSPEVVIARLASDLQGIAFDPSGNRLLVAEDRLTLEDYGFEEEPGGGATLLLMTGVRPDEPLAAHLLMHARQYERHGGDYLEVTTDRMLARAAWAEGEANVMAIRYLFEGMDLHEAVIDAGLHPGEFLDGSLLPPGLDQLSSAERKLVEFVYLEGFAQSANRYRQGGWPALDLAMSRRLTTADVLHADRPPGGPADFDPPSPPHESMQLVDEDSIGEQGVTALISTLSGKDNLGLQAGDGWLADRLYRWEAPGEPRAGVTDWITVWTSVEEAEDFEYAFGRALGKRFAGLTPQPDEQGGAILRTGGSEIRLKRAGDRYRITVVPTLPVDPPPEPLQPDPVDPRKP